MHYAKYRNRQMNNGNRCGEHDKTRNKKPLIGKKTTQEWASAESRNENLL